VRDEGSTVRMRRALIRGDMRRLRKERGIRIGSKEER
jgi:hypothetical protein